MLPKGQSLPAPAWHARHAGILVVLWAHALAIPVYGSARGFALSHIALESLVVPATAVLATWGAMSRRARTVVASTGLLASSAILVHLSGGLIEMHFHFFVMVAVVALYQDWLPFLVAVGFVFVHHGVVGLIDPDSVFVHLAGRDRPWLWAGIHAGFITGISAVCLVTWRLNETILDERRDAEHALQAETSVVHTLHDIGVALAGELATSVLVKRVIDATREVTGARFGAFFYNVDDGSGDTNMHYAVSGAPREAFDRLGTPQNTAMFAATFIGEEVVRVDDVLDDPRYGKSAPFHGLPPGHLPIRSFLGVPVKARDGVVIGGLFLGHPVPARFDEVHERLANGIAVQAGMAFDRAQQFEAEQAVALTLQKALLPSFFPEVHGVTFAARYLPSPNAAQVGGDWYDAFALHDGRLATSVGDVGGHDVRAAALMGELRTVARSYALDGHRPGEVLARLDAYMAAGGIHEFATAIHATYDPVERLLCLASAGHPPPLLMGPDGTASFLRCPPTPPLGFELIELEPCPGELTLRVQPGSTLIFFTDGLVERRGEHLDVGLQRLVDAATGCRSVDAQNVCDELVTAMVDSGADDDIALLILSIAG